MAILIDQPEWQGQGKLWSHLISDSSLEELHAFANEHGIPPRGFERDHYDVPRDYYEHLVTSGAHPVSSRQIVAALQQAGLRRRRVRSGSDARHRA